MRQKRFGVESSDVGVGGDGRLRGVAGAAAAATFSSSFSASEELLESEEEEESLEESLEEEEDDDESLELSSCDFFLCIKKTGKIINTTAQKSFQVLQIPLQLK
jgi:hypothetical protein